MLLNSCAKFQPAAYAPPTGFCIFPDERIFSAAAEKIRSSGKMQNPVGGAYAAGWNLAQEFNNMFLGYGGSHFEAGTAVPASKCEPP